MPLDLVTLEAEEVDVLMAKDAAEAVGEEAEKVDADMDEEVVGEEAANIKVGLISQISPVPLKIQSGIYPQVRQEK